MQYPWLKKLYATKQIYEPVCEDIQSVANKYTGLPRPYKVNLGLQLNTGSLA